MGKYQVESDFDDLHGDPADAVDLDVDLSDSDNPIIQAALANKGDDDYVPPKEEKDDKDDKDGEPEKFIDDDGDDDLLELDGDDDDDGDDGDDEGEDDGDDGDDEGDADGDDGDEGADKKGAWSKKVQARIDRERDLRLSDNAASNARIAELERTNELFRAQSTFKEDQRTADQDLRALRKKKASAIEEGDTEAQVDIDDKILDIKSERKVKAYELKQLENDIDKGVTTTVDGSNTPAAGAKWLEKYPQFHTNQQFQKTVLQADKMVAGRGLDKNTDKYYVEMEKILAPQFPEIVKVAKTTKKPKRRADTKRRRSAVGGTGKAGTKRGANRRGVIRLTKKDQEQMEVFGMDPHSPKDIKAWADSKGS